MAQSDDGSAGNDAGAQQEQQQEALPPPEKLISATIEALRKAKGIDVQLLDILADHILTDSPANKAVDNAAAAIEALAAKRAQGSEHEPTDHA